MSIVKTPTDVETLKINYLTQAMYEDALENDEINDFELYFTPDESKDVMYVNVTTNASIPYPSDSPSGIATDTDTCTLSVSFEDILAAIENGKKVVALVTINSDTCECMLQTNTSTEIVFMGHEAAPGANTIQMVSIVVHCAKNNSDSPATYSNNIFISRAIVDPIALNYTTTAPTANNTSGLKIALLSSEPATKYDGWIYLIQES